MLIFGANSLATYALFAWLPTRLTEAGVSHIDGRPHARGVRRHGGARRPRRAAPRGALPEPLLLTVQFVACFAIGLIGLLVRPTPAHAAVGDRRRLGERGFPLALTLVGLRSRSPAGAGRLSGFAQGWGYLLAGVGPIAAGVLRQATGGWTAPFVLIDRRPRADRRRGRPRGTGPHGRGRARGARAGRRREPAQRLAFGGDPRRTHRRDQGVPAGRRRRRRPHGRRPWRDPRRATRASVSTATGRPTSRCSWPSRPAGRRARSPTLLAARLGEVPGIKSVDVAGPGFLNIVLDAAAAGELARTIVEAGTAYGRTDAGAGHGSTSSSSRPTPPAPCTSAAPAGPRSATPRALLEATGAEVAREYYFNDHGAQIDRFAALAAAPGARGADARGRLRGQLHRRHRGAGRGGRRRPGPDPRTLPRDEAQEAFRRRGVDLMFAEIKASLHAFRVDFDVYFHENDLYADGAVERAVARLRELGRIFEADGAVWLRTTDLGDDKDRVVIKSDGEAAYIAGDLAYYLDKRERGFDRCVIMLGADHHGYVGRLMAMAAAFGDTPHVNLEVLIGQLVNLVKDGQPVRMSKRAGTVVTMRGPRRRRRCRRRPLLPRPLVRRRQHRHRPRPADAAHEREPRLLRAVRRTRASPASCATPWRTGCAARTRSSPRCSTTRPTPSCWPRSAEFPRIVAQAAELREPHRVARYLEELAGHFHSGTSTLRVTPRARRTCRPTATAPGCG